MIPLVAPTITRRDRDYIAHSVYNGLLNNEREVRRFEEEFAAYVGAKWAVAVCSGTQALRVAAFNVVHWGSIPSYTCSAVASGTGGETLVDSTFDVRTATMTQEPASVLVHMFGKPTLSKGREEIEDWTLSLGAELTLRGRIGVCSTHESKMISTGRGGILFSNDDEILVRVREHQDSSRFGQESVGMSSLQAALGLTQLRQLPEFIARRREIAAFYSNAFSGAGLECPDADCGSVFFRYLIAVDDPAGKVAELATRGIEAGRGVYPPLHQQFGESDAEFPGATQAVNTLLSVPCHPSLTDKQVRYIAEQVVEVCAP